MSKGEPSRRCFVDPGCSRRVAHLRGSSRYPTRSIHIAAHKVGLAAVVITNCRERQVQCLWTRRKRHEHCLTVNEHPSSAWNSGSARCSCCRRGLGAMEIFSLGREPLENLCVGLVSQEHC